MNDHALPRLLASFRGSFTVLWVFSIFFNLLMLTQPLFMLVIFSNVLTSRSLETLMLVTMAATLALLIQAGLDLVRSRVLIRVGVTLDAQLTPQVLDALLRHAAGSTRRNAQRLRDVATLRGFITGPQIFTLFDAPFVPLYVVVIYLLHPALGHLAFLGSLALLAIAAVNELITRAPMKDAMAASRSAQQRVEEFVRNADAIEAMGMMPAVIDQWQVHNSKSLSALARTGDSGSITSGLAKFVRMMLQVGVYAVGAYLYLQDQIMAGAIVAASILLARALAPVQAAIVTWKGMVSARDAYLRLKEILAPERMKRYRDRMSLPTPEGRLQLDRIVVATPAGDRLTLKAVSFSLEPGEFLGVVGPSGAGKSTLAKLLVGIVAPKGGSARLDGVDLASWHPDELGVHVGYLPQDVQLFAGTVRENIARLSRDNDSDAVLQAARMAGVHDMIVQLPNGYDSDIGEGGALLSAGQRQHIGLARALYGKPRLLVLDEPNSNLDAVGEEALLVALDEAKRQGITIVVVTHRPSVLHAADKMLMLKNGLVELYGPRARVMAQLSPGAAAPRKAVSQAPQAQLSVVQGEH